MVQITYRTGRCESGLRREDARGRGPTTTSWALAVYRSVYDLAILVAQLEERLDVSGDFDESSFFKLPGCYVFSEPTTSVLVLVVVRRARTASFDSWWRVDGRSGSGRRMVRQILEGGLT